MTMMRTFFCLTVVLLLTSLASAQVTVNKQPVTSTVRYFDPKKPPADMPKLVGNEAAVCVSNFNISASAGGDVLEQDKVDGACRTTVRIDRITLTLECDIVIWLPNKPPKKIVEHEDGHKEITERFYKDADAVAKKYANQWLGRSVRGSAKTCQEASSAAISSAAQEMSGQYMTAVQGESSKVQEAYDRITAHGTNKLTARQGVDRAMAEYERTKR